MHPNLTFYSLCYVFFHSSTLCITFYSLCYNLQIRFAGILSLFYAMLMMVVVVGLGLEMKREGLCSPTTIFTIFIVGAFIISAILHPQEFYCLLHGAIYFLAIPSMSMILMIYSICNLHVVSWGTRENAVAAPPTTPQQNTKKVQSKKIKGILNKFQSKENEDVSEYAFSFGNLFKCLCCPQKPSNTTEDKFAAVLAKLETLEATIAGKKDNSTTRTEETAVDENELKKKESIAEEKTIKDQGVRCEYILSSQHFHIIKHNLNVRKYIITLM